MMQSASYSTPPNTSPFSVIRWIPRPLVSTSDAAPHRVDQRDVRPVEGRQIVVIESRALAELAVPRLQRLRGALVLDELVDARADLIHLFEVGNFREASDLFHRYRRGLVPSHEQAAKVADDVGPSVADQVDICGQA